MARDVKRFAFQAIGLLSQRMPQLFEYLSTVALVPAWSFFAILIHWCE